MIVVLLLFLLLLSVPARWLGSGTGDDHGERVRPDRGLYPGLMGR